MKRTLVLCAAFFAALTPLAAQSVEAFRPTTARMAALGGPHAAAAIGMDALFENPAGFASDEQTLGVSSLVVHPSGPVFDLASLLVSGGTDQLMAGLVSLLDGQGRLYVDLDLLGPLSFGYTGKGLGFGLFNQSRVTVDAMSLLSASMSVSEGVCLAGGYAHRFSLPDGSALDAGIMPKGFVKASMDLSGSVLDFMTVISDTASLLSGTPFVVTSGLGFDVGAKWSKNGFAAAIVARDAFSPALVTTYSSFDAFASSPASAQVGESAYALVPADLTVGVGYTVEWPLLDRFGMDLTLLADYKDLLDLFSVLPRNPILNASLGVELTLLDILSLRAGVCDALPAAGFGVDLSFFTLSLAMYGKELGLEPGARPVYNLVVALDFVY